MKEYTINIKSHFSHLWSMIVFAIVLPIAGYYLMVIKLGEYNLQTASIAGLIVFAIFMVPLLLLHANYYFNNKEDFFGYDESQGLLIYGGDKTELRFRRKDIEFIICYKSRPLAENRTPIFPWDIYNYAVIQLKDGTIIKISSLLVSEFDKKIKVGEIEIKKTFYPWIC